MKHDWLLEVLLDIQAYAIRENCMGLLPHIDAAYEAAREECPGFGQLDRAEVLSEHFRINGDLRTEPVGVAHIIPFERAKPRRSTSLRKISS